MREDKELQELAVRLYDLATEVQTIKNPVEFIALLLLLKKEDLLYFPTYDHHFGNKYNEDIYDEIRNAIHHLEQYELQTYLLSISESILGYSREDFINIVNFIEYLADISKGYYGKLLDEIIFYAANSGDKSIVEGAQPREITLLVQKICKGYDIDTIYNPFAGIGSYYTAFTTSSSSCTSQEINQSTWILGTIRCLLYNISPYKYMKGDSIMEWHNHQRYDLIVAFPPLNYRMPSSYRDDGHINYVDDFVMKNISQLHSHNTVFIGLFGRSFLSRQFSSSKWLRRYIVDNDILEAIITLPSNILYGTSASTAIIVVNSNKRERNRVTFVDGSQYYTKNGKINVLDADDLLDAINSNEKECVRIISTSEIREQDYTLDVKRYFYQEDENLERYKVRTLKDILKPIRGEKNSINVEKQAKIIKFSNLKEDIVNYTITPKDLNIGKVQKDYQRIWKDSILVSARFGELKPTYINIKDDDEIYHITGIRAFELKKTSDISLEYLMYYLNSKSIKEYVKAYSVGTTIQFLSNKDLENIRIPVPPIRQQERILNAVRKTHKEGSVKESDLERYIKEKKQEYIEELRIKKHTLSQSFSNFDASINALYAFLRSKDGCMKIDDLISEKRQITVARHIENMIDSSRRVGELIEKLTNDIEFEPAREINLNRFLLEYVNNYPHNDQFEFVYERDNDSLWLETEVEGAMTEVSTLVSISSKELSGALEDIVSNAQIHGFTELNRKYIIRIGLSYDVVTNMVIINIENNGNPLPKGLDIKRYKTKNEIGGKTGGSGIGGFHCSQVIEHYRGELSLIRNDSSEYPVLISIKLPLIKK